MSSWWDSITTNAQLLVEELSAQANDATNEIIHEQQKLKKEEEARKAKNEGSLPWESDDEKKSIISEALMTDILQLSPCENNFTVCPPTKIVECCRFDFQYYIPQAMKLLSLDQNLAHIHAKLSPKMNEELFWRNYFARVYYLKCKSGLLDQTDDPMIQAVISFDEDNVIYKADTSSVKIDKAKPTSHVTSVKKSGWDNNSSEDVSGSESAMSTSSYEVVNAVGHNVSAMASDTQMSVKLKEESNVKAQIEAETSNNNANSEIEDEDFDDLGDFDDLDGLDDCDEDDDDELEAQIARELANEE